MRETTMLEVMAEVSRMVNSLERTPPAVSGMSVVVGAAIENGAASLRLTGDARRNALFLQAAWSLVALHAHDAEAAQAPAYNPGPEGS